jgi:hypothetical protein
MNVVEYFNGRVEKLTVFDIKLIQLAAMCLILIIVKLIPRMLEISVWWYVLILIVVVIRPAYAFFFKE